MHKERSLEKKKKDGHGWKKAPGELKAASEPELEPWRPEFGAAGKYRIKRKNTKNDSKAEEGGFRKIGGQRSLAGGNL